MTTLRPLHCFPTQVNGPAPTSSTRTSAPVGQFIHSLNQGCNAAFGSVRKLNSSTAPQDFPRLARYSSQKLISEGRLTFQMNFPKPSLCPAFLTTARVLARRQ